jgi:hypothetical protein
VQMAMFARPAGLGSDSVRVPAHPSPPALIAATTSVGDATACPAAVVVPPVAVEPVGVATDDADELDEEPPPQPVATVATRSVAATR